MLSAYKISVYGTLTGLGYTVTDTIIKTNGSLPYIRIGDDRLIQLVCKDNDYFQLTSNIHVFSIYDGTKESNTIIQDIINNINVNLDITGYKITACMLRGTQTIVEPDTMIKHSIVTLEFKIK